MNSVAELFVRRTKDDAPWTYQALDELQRDLADGVRKGRPGALILSELEPVITLGRRADPARELHAPERLKVAGIDVLKTDRGGLATYHGPGQWVAFVVDGLEPLTGDSKGVRRAVQGLLAAGLRAARQWEPRAEIRDGEELGIWGPQGKLGSVGVAVRGGVLLHGLAINGYATAASFVGLRPCGLEKPVSFLIGSEDLAIREREFERLGRTLISELQAEFWPETSTVDSARSWV